VVDDLQSTKSEDATQGELVLPHPLQAPDDGQRKTEDNKVYDYVKYLVHDEEGVFVKAFGLNALVPVAP
jgi:hypothetical protein